MTINPIVARRLLKRIGLDAEQFLKDCRSSTEAEAMISSTLRMRDLFFHPDKKLKDDKEFQDWQDVRNEIVKYKASEIYSALKSRKPGKADEPKANCDQELADMAYEFVLGNYRRRLASRIAGKYLVLKSPHDTFANKGIHIPTADLDSTVEQMMQEKSEAATEKRILFLERTLRRMVSHRESDVQRISDIKKHHVLYVSVASRLEQAESFHDVAETIYDFYAGARKRIIDSGLEDALEDFDALEMQRKNVDEDDEKELSLLLSDMNNTLLSALPKDIRGQYIGARMMLRRLGTKDDYAMLAKGRKEDVLPKAAAYLEQRWTYVETKEKKNRNAIPQAHLDHCKGYLKASVERRMDSGEAEIKEIMKSDALRAQREKRLRAELDALKAGDAMAVVGTVPENKAVDTYLATRHPFLQAMCIGGKGRHMPARTIIYIGKDHSISYYNVTGQETTPPKPEDFIKTNRRAFALLSGFTLPAQPKFLIPGAAATIALGEVFPGHIVVDQKWYDRFTDETYQGISLLSVEKAKHYRIEGQLAGPVSETIDGLY